MINHKVRNNPGKITFTFAAADAEQVCLAGDFNGWDITRHPLKQKKSGEWQIAIELPAGDFEYKFLVDGIWEVDPENPHKRRNAFGTFNSLLIVGD